MSATGLLIIGVGALLVWAGFTGTQLWPEIVAVFGGRQATP